jgi:hypothetical protein
MFKITAALLLLSLTAAATASAVNPTKCVTIKVYNSNDELKCQGTPSQILSFSTYSQRGDSPCFWNSRVPDVSIDNLYCTDTYFHQTIYMGSETCSIDDSKTITEEKYNAGECFHNAYHFESCIDGPCASSDAEDDEMAVAFWHMTSEG